MRFALLAPMALALVSCDTSAPPAPEFGTVAQVSNARLVLPAVAGEPAAVYLQLTNAGENDLVVSGVGVEHAERAVLDRGGGPAASEAANVNVLPGQSLQFTPEGYHIAAIGYDSTVVPGATVDVTLTFGTAGTVTVPANVEAPAALVPPGVRGSDENS